MIKILCIYSDNSSSCGVKAQSWIDFCTFKRNCQNVYNSSWFHHITGWEDIWPLDEIFTIKSSFLFSICKNRFYSFSLYVNICVWVHISVYLCDTFQWVCLIVGACVCVLRSVCDCNCMSVCVCVCVCEVMYLFMYSFTSSP